MPTYRKPRLHSIENILKQKTSDLSEKDNTARIEAIYEEALGLIRSALNGDDGMIPMEVPFLCAALRIWVDVLRNEMDEEALKECENSYQYMKNYYQFETGVIKG